METMTLKLRGKDANGGEVYRSYFLVTDGGRLGGRGRATVVPMSIGAPMPTPDFVEVPDGGEIGAMHRLVERLQGLPGNLGLMGELDDRPT